MKSLYARGIRAPTSIFRGEVALKKAPDFLLGIVNHERRDEKNGLVDKLLGICGAAPWRSCEASERPISAGRRDLKVAMLRGFLGRCPNCGRGEMFGKFLKVNEHCSCCDEVLYNYDAAYSAELAPAFLVQSLVSVPVGVGLVWAAAYTDWSVWAIMALWTAVTILLSIGQLQPTKGAVIGLQWAQRMEGFGPNSRR